MSQNPRFEKVRKVKFSIIDTEKGAKLQHYLRLAHLA